MSNLDRLVISLICGVLSGDLPCLVVGLGVFTVWIIADKLIAKYQINF